MKSKIDDQRNDEYLAQHARAERDSILSEQADIDVPEISANTELVEKVKTAFSLQDLNELENEVSADGLSSKAVESVYRKEQQKKVDSKLSELASRYKKPLDWLMKL